MVGLTKWRVDDVFLTGDKNLRYQQRIETRSIAIVEVAFTRLDSLNP